MHTTTPKPRYVVHFSKCRAQKVTLLFTVTLLTALALIVVYQFSVQAQAPAPVPHEIVKLASLKTVPVPVPANIANFIKDNAAAIALGKALFWDQQVGSDGQACASCHFHAGADSRSKNQLNPGFRAVPPDFNFTPPFGLNYQLQASDFPFHRLTDLNNQNSAVLFDTNDVASSQGVRNFTFSNIVLRSPNDNGTASFAGAGGVFQAGTPPALVRNVEPRNTPTVINAVFNHRNFWDGRARNEFNGVDPIGNLDPTARVLIAPTASQLAAIGLSGRPDLKLENSSLASQAVGPPLSDLEMSYGGRTFPLLGRKMFSVQPLALQHVATDDSVLGSMSMLPATGISRSYNALIQAAFQPQWWQSNLVVRINGTNPDGTLGLTFILPPPGPLDSNTFTQMEFNFSLFWGLAIQMYEATLVANDSPVDQFLDGNTSVLTAQEQLGMNVFEAKGRCVNCHGGAETTNASVANVVNAQELLERMVMGNSAIAVYDNGFYNTGVRRCAGLQGPCDDVGIGATIGPLTLPLSNSRFFQKCIQDTLAKNPTFTVAQANAACQVPPIKVRPNESPLLANPQPLQPNERVAVDGAFKTPGLRNVELTAPYFHNGGDSTLEQVVDFYNRGGNFAQFNQDNLDPDIQVLNLTLDEKAALVAFMKALTDERVRFHQAPFDHPELCVSTGHASDTNPFTQDESCNATQDVLRIPQVGAGGLAAPRPNFLDPPGASTGPVPITTNISPSSVTYGDAGFTLMVNGRNFVPNSVVRFAGSDRATTFINGMQLTVFIPGSDLATVGSFTITVFTPTPPGGGASNAQTFTVNRAVLTVTAADASRTYGDPNPAFTGTIAGIKNGDNITATYASSATTVSPAGAYPIVPTVVDPGNKLVNYTVVSTNGTLTVNKAALIVTANDASKVYGAPLPAFSASYSGFVLGEAPSVLGGTLGFTTAATASSSVAGSPYPITPAGLTSTNYNITFVAGKLTVTPAALTVTANDASKVYGAPLPAFSASYSGFVLGEAASVLGGTLGFTTAATASSSVAGSPYPITPAGLTSTNYSITFVAGKLTVTPAALTVTANDASKVYGAPLPAFSASYSGFVLGEAASVLGGTLGFTTAATASSLVAGSPYPITPAGLTSTNYNITFVAGKLNVTPAPLTIRADDETKILDAPNPAFTATYAGFVLGETPSVLTTRPSCTTTATTLSPVGKYPTTCSGAVSTNYAITYVAGTLTVIYAPGGLCLGQLGHSVLPPINADGSSVMNPPRTVPAKFRVCDANSVPVGTPGVVSSFFIYKITDATGTYNVNRPVDSATPDTVFRWDGQQWIFNISTKNMSANATYYFRIGLNDGTFIDFSFSLK